MNRLFTRNNLLIIAGATLHAAALTLGSFYLAWICLIPLFIAIQNCSGKKAFYLGAFYGSVFACLAFFWVPIAVLSLPQGTIVKAMLAGVLLLAVTIIYYGIIMLCFSFLRRSKKNVFEDALLMAAIWTVSDFVLSLFSNGMPWFSTCIGNALLGNLYAIQPAEYGGISFLGFCVVFINYLFAHFSIAKQWKKMFIPIGFILIYIFAGYLILYNFLQNWKPSGKPVRIALVSGNISDSEPWNDENGNTLIRDLLRLNEQALSTQPDMVLWPESVVPWSYKGDDDFIKTVLKNTSLLPATYQIIGMNTTITNNELYNSAYFFLPDGNIAGRYDKHYLVSIAEQPLCLFSKPSFSNNGESYFRRGEKGKTVATSKGRVGVLICNEVFIPIAALNAVKDGAVFLVSLASDAVVASAPIAMNQQFLRSRLRAVEVRKDIAVSCNMGVSGMIAATGEIFYSEQSDDGLATTISVTPNMLKPKPQHLKFFFIYLSIIIIIIFLYLNFLKTKTT